MKFSCEKALLSAAVATTSRAVAVKSSIPALEGILIEAGEQLRLTGYNLETGIRAAVPAEIREKGSLVLSARLFGEIIRKMPDDVVVFTSENYMVNIKCGLSEFNILGTDPEEFPELPSVEEQNGLTIGQPVLRSMIAQTLFAVSDNESRPVHTGSLFEVDESGLTVVSVDGYRLAIIEKPVKAAKDISIIIPAKTLAEAIKLFTDDDEVVHIAANRRFVVFSSRTYTVISRLIEGDFLDYKRVIPEGYHTRVTVDVRDFSNSIERASLIITERLKNPLRITFDGNITVRCQTTLGKVVDELDAEIEGEPVEIGFNNRYLLDALRYSRCDKLVFEVSGPLSPVKVLPKDGGDFLFLVLPVRFKND